MRGVQRGISALFLVISILAVAIASAAGYFVFSQDLKEKVGAINSFEECAKHYPVMESYPEQCKTPDGKHFTRELTEEEKQRLILPTESSQAQQNEAANWKTYTNTGLKYSIDYPSSIASSEIFLIESSAGDVNFTDTKPPIPVNKLPKNIYVSISENKQSLSTSEYIENILNEKSIIVEGGRRISIKDQPDLMTNIKREKILVDGLNGEKINGLPSAYGRIEVFVSKGNKVYYFALEPNPIDQEWVKVFDRMIESFKFLD